MSEETKDGDGPPLPAPSPPAAPPVIASSAPAGSPSPTPDWLRDTIDLALVPIPGAEPSGDSAVTEEPYLALEVEVKKPEALDPKPVEWSKVEQLARELLAKRTKDLKVAAYLAVALAELRGPRGHAMAGALLASLTGRFGATLWPRRPRGRHGALEWSGERLLAHAEKLRATRSDEAALGAAVEQARAAHKACQAAFEEPGQPVEPLVFLRKWGEALARQHAEALRAGGPIRPVEVLKQSPTGAVDGLSLDSPEDAKRAAPKLRTLLGKCAEKMRTLDLTDPGPYRAARFAVWPDKLSFEFAPDGQTGVPMLDPPAAQALMQQVEAQPAAEAVAALETLFVTRPWWLDLQRVLVQKLESLGERYASAATAVAAETAALVRRFPKLLDARFRGGVEFAAGPTRSWLAGLAGAGHARGPEDGATDPVAAAIDEAQAVAARGDLRGALGVFQRALGVQAEPEPRFLLRLGLARTCLASGHPGLALPHLEELRAELESRKLRDWAPSLAGDVLRSTVLALRAASKEKGANPELKQRAIEALAELSRLDPLAALELGP